MIAQGGDRWLGQIHGAPAAQTIARRTGYTDSRAGWRLVAGGGVDSRDAVVKPTGMYSRRPTAATNRHPALPLHAVA